MEGFGAGAPSGKAEPPGERAWAVEQQKFGKQHVEDDLEALGLDVRPALDVRAEGEKLFNYASYLRDTWPRVYENIVQGPGKFVVTKQFVFPGKGEIETQTFTITPRGPVFMFPRMFGMFQEETDLPACGDVVLDAMEEFRKVWPVCKHIRLGVIRTYVLDCREEDPLEMIAGRFMRLEAPKEGDLRIRINRREGGYNRIIELEVVEKYGMEPPGVPRHITDKLKVKADFNNDDMSADLGREELAQILVKGRSFCETDVFRFLNREEDE